MQQNEPQSVDRHLQTALESDERLEIHARTLDATLGVSNRRLLVVSPERLHLAVPFEGLRRIQFDIERQRPATLVIVPEDAGHEPQVLAIPPSEYPAVAEALVSIGLHIYPHNDQSAGEATG